MHARACARTHKPQAKTLADRCCMVDTDEMCLMLRRSGPVPCWTFKTRAATAPGGARKQRSDGARQVRRGPDGHRRALLAGQCGAMGCGRSKAPAKICAPLVEPWRLWQDGARASGLYPLDSTLDLKPFSSATRPCAERAPGWWRSFSVIADVGRWPDSNH